MATDKINYDALGQAIDTTFGRSSTPKSASFSVKFKLEGSERLVANYVAIVNFGSEARMIDMKRRYADESVAVISEVMKVVKKTYKDLTGKTLSAKESASNESLEIIGSSFHNPKRTAYYRKQVAFEIA